MMKIYAGKKILNRKGDSSRVMNVTLMMLILAFFIVLYSMSVPSPDNKKAALGSLIGSLGILPGGTSPMQSEKKQLNLAPGFLSTEKIGLAFVLNKFEQFVLEKRDNSYIRTMISQGGIAVFIENKKLFKPGSAVIKKEAIDLLVQLGKLLKQLDGEVVVEGHMAQGSGTVSARYGTAQGLSVARAGAVLRYLLAIGDLDKNKFSISGYGTARPMDLDLPEGETGRNDTIRIIYKRAI